jgi:hypothetical protein
MNKKEAKEVLIQELKHLQTKSIEELQVLIQSPEVILRDGAGGVSYQIEIQAFWDNPRESGGDLRVVASIDDGGLISAFFPISSDFLVDSAGDIKAD